MPVTAPRRLCMVHNRERCRICPRRPKRAKPRPVVLAEGELLWRYSTAGAPGYMVGDVSVNAALLEVSLGPNARGPQPESGPSGTLLWQPAAPRRAKR